MEQRFTSRFWDKSLSMLLVTIKIHLQGPLSIVNLLHLQLLLRRIALWGGRALSFTQSERTLFPIRNGAVITVLRSFGRVSSTS